MATKAGRAELKDIRAGKTLWRAGLNVATGKRFPQRVTIERGIRRDGNSDWRYSEAITGQLTAFRLILLDNFPPNHRGEPCFDKLFVSLSAVKRWIRRYESNRIETLCEDRRVFKHGSHFIRRSGIDTVNLADNQFVSTEQWLVKDVKYKRHPVSTPPTPRVDQPAAQISEVPNRHPIRKHSDVVVNYLNKVPRTYTAAELDSVTKLAQRVIPDRKKKE